MSTPLLRPNNLLYIPRLITPRESRKIICNDNKLTAKKNTLRAYKDEKNPKRQIFIDMCAYVQLDNTVTSDKVTSFMLYMALQSKAKSNKRKKFNSDSYDQIFNSNALADIDTDECAIMKVKDPLGYTSVKHHLYAVQALHYEQMQDGIVENWNDCYSIVARQIVAICRKRKKLSKIMNDEEDDDKFLVAYNSVDNIANIFDYLYIEAETQNTSKKKYEILRSSAMMSCTMFGVLRGETMLDANLSDMKFLTINGWDPSRIDLLLIRMIAGMLLILFIIVITCLEKNAL